jgi:hypothetical protein
MRKKRAVLAKLAITKKTGGVGHTGYEKKRAVLDILAMRKKRAVLDILAMRKKRAVLDILAMRKNGRCWTYSSTFKLLPLSLVDCHKKTRF